MDNNLISLEHSRPFHDQPYGKYFLSIIIIDPFIFNAGKKYKPFSAVDLMENKI